MIVINARFLTQSITGVQRFAIELCKRLPSKIGDEEVVFVAPKSKSVTHFSKDINIIQFGYFSGNLWEQIELPKFLSQKGKPLLINLVGIAPIFYKNKIMALYDLAFKHYPEWFSFSFQKTYNTLIPISIRRTKFIITDSYYVKDDICKQFKINKEKIEVLYAAPAKMFRDNGIQKNKIILTVSSLDPRKNLLRVINAFNLLDTEYELVIVGKKNKSFASIDFKDYLNNPKIKFTGYLTDDELVKLYNTSEIFVYASLFEGFGIPPLEAQACGCSCIVSNKTSLPEVYGNSVLYCDPYEVESIKECINTLIENPETRLKLKKLGTDNVAKYDWNNSASQLIKIIEKHI
ncbi:glycosyltransferase family 4 protein [Flagellimonas zhangzhouensis]|uniref:Glycosyltransferase involved in cell wall bisynthesis n=1 Tax=Flagellimonas zhangzhouensis TaxID=1073328 RepID=A0A1H2UQU5_9FLAO|nr:glycosyltransferase family 1 protein [Allomuricauda zhangzhouensis]SDQ14677.1 Glycosyltransferase involved in cell wall bisynthesis [Allomuricauda zhangzhouensis]SDW58475.1 Glycosyltransferase involved in cell wall bisynthesis [Allomuricauda zhangzhouensis]